METENSMSTKHAREESLNTEARALLQKFLQGDPAFMEEFEDFEGDRFWASRMCIISGVEASEKVFDMCEEDPLEVEQHLRLTKFKADFLLGENAGLKQELDAARLLPSQLLLQKFKADYLLGENAGLKQELDAARLLPSQLLLQKFKADYLLGENATLKQQLDAALLVSRAERKRKAEESPPREPSKTHIPLSP